MDMTTKAALILAVGSIAVLADKVVAAETVAAEDLYIEKCAECHEASRLGGIGPALLPGNLKRLRKKAAVDVIANGRAATQMPAFGDQLTPEQITSLVELIYTKPEETPVWGVADIKDSHEIVTAAADLPEKPVFDADPLNLFTVVEGGDHSVTILDGDKFEPLARFPTRYALHGGAKYSPDGRFVYLGSRDGWVSKYDLYSFKTVAEVRAGINTRNIATSSDGRWIAVGNYLPHNVVILNAEDLTLHKVIPVEDGKGQTSRVSAVYNAPPRNSFIVALKDFQEVWELSYDPEADPVTAGFAHNNRVGVENEAIVIEEQPFARKRMKVDSYLDDFFFDPYYAEVIGASRGGKGGSVYNLDGGKKIASLELDGMPHLGSGIYWTWQGRPVMATPHLKEGAVSVIDMESWQTVKKIKTMGPGFFMRSHENSRYAWVDVFFGPNKDVLHVIDKETLEIVKTVKPAPGKTAAHVEFTRDGKYALVSIWEQEGALVIYDAETLVEVKRIPMKKPVGKYNVYNKITYSSGTSH